jgi:nicotinamidase-related amidase
MQQQQQQQRPRVLSSFAWQVQPQTLGKTMLIISDMQTGFAYHFGPNLVTNVCRLIDQAMARNWDIIVLECVGYGETMAPIRQRLAGYDQCFTVLKHGEDGTYAVLAACTQRQLSTKHYVACGVSVNVCLRLTVGGLAYSSGHPTVDVITEACGDNNGARWDQYPEASHVRLIPSLGC